jgi:hypothetical protein
MKIVSPSIAIKVDLLNLTPAEIGEVSLIIANLNVKAEWVIGDTCCVVSFRSIETYCEFLRLVGSI